MAKRKRLSQNQIDLSRDFLALELKGSRNFRTKPNFSFIYARCYRHARVQDQPV
jgi:hypothetical protein